MSFLPSLLFPFVVGATRAVFDNAVCGRTLAGLGLGETIGLRLRPFLAVLHPTRRRCWNSFFARGRTHVRNPEPARIIIHNHVHN